MEDYSFLPDPQTDIRLLPSSMIFQDNRRELDFYKKALPLAIEYILDDSQRYIIQAYYYQGKTQTEIAQELGVGAASISKKMAAIYKKLKPYLQFAGLIWKEQEQHHMLFLSESAVMS